MSDFTLKVEKDIAILEFDQPDSKANILKSETMEELKTILDRLQGEFQGKVKALLITSKKDGIFIAGANIKEIESISSTADAIAKADMGKQILEQLEKLPLVTVAVINGACLGGGLELALACKYRVAGLSDKIKIGLPEVKLGILPGFGGTIRLPKLMGLTTSLGWILQGKIASGKDALKFGVVDRLFMDMHLLSDAIQFTNDILSEKIKIRRTKKKKMAESFLEDTPIGRSIVFSQAKKTVMKSTKGQYPAPLKIIDVLQKNYGKDLKTASRIESQGFGDLGGTLISKNLIHIFYLDENYKKKEWTEKAATPIKIDKCAVVGAGVMGGGIAQLLASRGIPSRLKDIHPEALKLALRTARGVYSYLLKKRKLKLSDVEKQMLLISTTLDYSGFQNAPVVIEAVIEDLNVKRKVFEELEKNTNPSALLVSNTSSLPISKMAEVTKRPDKVAGFHFFNPVHRMPLLEIIKTDKTSEETVATLVAFARKLGKMVIVVKDATGFLVNRILLPYMNEAAYLLEEGFDMLRLDRLAKSFGMPMGPMELADEVGIDVGYKVAKILEEAYGERMRVASILHDIKETKMYGKKTNKGFYIYEGKEKRPNTEIFAKLQKKDVFPTTETEAIERLIYIMVNEASRCLHEGVVDKPHTVDVGMIYGTGFPPFRGGLLRYADTVGIQKIVDSLRIFEQRYGNKRFTPSPLLLQMAESGKKFYE